MYHRDVPGQLFHIREAGRRRLLQAEVRYGVLAARLGLIALAAAVVAVRRGYAHPPAPEQLMLWGQTGLLLLYGIDVWVGKRFGRVTFRGAPPAMIEGVFWGVGLFCSLVAIATGPYGVTGVLADGMVGVLLCVELWRMHLGLSHSLRRPGMLLPLSFLMLIAVGTVLLKLPLAAAPGKTIGWYDALFTMTSAVCVTGLSVRDTANDFSPLGQAIIGIFIQLGGLGIIIFGSLFAMLVGASISLRQQATLSQMLDDQPLERLSRMVKFIVLGTLAIELVGAAAMMPMWPADLPLNERVGLSLFHSVSAFCNAGFALQSDSLEQFRYSPITHMVILPLLVVGGLGFPVLNELVDVVRWRFRFRGRKRIAPGDKDQRLAGGRLSLHTRLVLIATASLYLFGFAGIFLSQTLPYAHDEMQLGQTVNRDADESASVSGIAGHFADASFMSLTARTAGFNSMPMSEMQPGSNMVVMVLMCVGGSPGGTAGGMKTITVFLVVLSIVATVRARDQTEAFQRQINDAIVRRAAAVGLAFVVLMATSTFLLLLSEPFPLMPVMFEAVSAATTTGLSLGITSELTSFGRGVIIVTMFLGRIGPLALLVAAMGATSRTRAYQYPHENVMLG